MPIYDGVVTIEDDEFHVILGLEDDTVRMSAGGREIGEWGPDECTIVRSEDGTFTITAENETLQFVPNSPTNFAAAMDDGRLPETIPDDDEVHTEIDLTLEEELPDPKTLTKVGFYALTAFTGAMGIWALVRIIV